MWLEIIQKTFKEFEKAGDAEIFISLEAGPNDVDFASNSPIVSIFFKSEKPTDAEIGEHSSDYQHEGKYISVNTSEESRLFRFDMDEVQITKKRAPDKLTKRTFWLLVIPVGDWGVFYKQQCFKILLRRNQITNIVISLTPTKPGRTTILNKKPPDQGSKNKAIKLDFPR